MPQSVILFSVVVPTFNRRSQLLTCLQALAELDYPRDHFEVLIVNDGGTDSLEAIVSPWRETMDVTLIELPHGGPAAARNAAAARARGAVLVFTSDDCAPCRDWLARLDERVRRNPDAAVGGAILHGLPEDLYATASHLLIDYLYRYYNADPEHASFFTPNNLAIPKDRFLAVGCFDESFSWGTGEDRDLCDRWLRVGERMLYAQEVRVVHRHPSNLRDFWRQHFRYGYGSRTFRARVAAREAAGIRLEPPRFYLQLITHPMIQPATAKTIRLSLLLVLAQVANTLGFLWPRRPRAPLAATSVPPTPRS